MFNIVPANEWNKLDTRPGKCPSVWTRDDVKDAMAAHAKGFGLARTYVVLEQVTGITLAPPANNSANDLNRGALRHMPERHYGPLIAALCKEIINKKEPA